MAKTTLTKTDMEKLYTISVEMVQKLQQVMARMDIHTHTKAVKIVLICAAIGFISTLWYYLSTGIYTWFLLFIGLSIPILIAVIADQSRVTKSLMKEYDDYSAAMKALLSAMTDSSKAMSDDVVTQAIAAAISAATTVSPEKVDEILFKDLRVLPQYKTALVMADQLVAIRDAGLKLKKEGLDVNKILETLEFEESLTAPIETDPHIIDKNDDNEEDLSIVV